MSILVVVFCSAALLGADAFVVKNSLAQPAHKQRQRRRQLLRTKGAAVPVDVSGDGKLLKIFSEVRETDKTPLRSFKPQQEGRIFDEDGAVAELTYEAFAGDTLLARGEALQYTVGNDEWIKGFDRAVRSMKIGERATFECASDYAYGAGNVVLPADATLRFEVEALDYKGNVYTSATFSDLKPLTPRTAPEIREEYERRRARRAQEKSEELEESGNFLERAIAKFNTFYFFGFFESATGETPPWFLRPLITFPAIFAAVGLSFFFLVNNDIILLKGTQPTIQGGSNFALESANLPSLEESLPSPSQTAGDDSS